MLALLKKIWHFLALIAGVGLIVFELTKRGGITAESWFWLAVGVMIVVLAMVEIVHRMTRGEPPPPPPD